MAKKATLTDITTGYTSQEVINDNLDALNDALENTLSRDGSAPNQMEADLDMNSNDILNAKDVKTDNLYVNGTKVVSTSATPDWKSAWVTATAYVVDDLVREEGSSYICLEAHTSGTFSTDLAAGKWELFAQKGSAGAGTGDLLAANNLSDVANTDTALSNLGGGTKGIEIFKDTTTGAIQQALDLETGVDVQAHDAVLDDLSGLSLVQGDVLYYNGTNLSRLAKGTNGQVLTMNSGATAPEWTTPSAGITRGTADNITGNSSSAFTSIPSDVRKIELILHNVSLSGSDDLLVQIGDSGGYETTSYFSSSSYVTSTPVGSGFTTGFGIIVRNSSRSINGTVELLNITGNTWVMTFEGGDGTTGSAVISGGRKGLSSTLDRVKLITSGSNTFSSGIVNIFYR